MPHPHVSNANQAGYLQSRRLAVSHSMNRDSQYYECLKQLRQHPDRLAHLSVIIPLLELNSMSWEYIQYLRSDEQTANVLRIAWPQLYILPDEIFEYVRELRADSRWENVQDVCIRMVAEGNINADIPASYRLSGWSDRSSTASNTSNTSNNTQASSCGSHSSMALAVLPEKTYNSSSPMSHIKDDDACTPNVCDIIPVDSTMARSSYEWPHQCHLEGCGKRFKYKGALENHMGRVHSSHGTNKPSRKAPNAPWEHPLPRSPAENHGVVKPAGEVPQTHNTRGPDAPNFSRAPGNYHQMSDASERLYSVISNRMPTCRMVPLLPPAMEDSYPPDFDTRMADATQASLAAVVGGYNPMEPDGYVGTADNEYEAHHYEWRRQ